MFVYIHVHVGTLMETPIGSSASRVIGTTPPGPMPSMPSTDHDLTIQPLDSTTASPTLKTQIEVCGHLMYMPGWLWGQGAVAQWMEHLQLKQEDLGSIPSGCPGFSSFIWLANVDGMKDLLCSSTVRLLSTQI